MLRHLEDNNAREMIELEMSNLTYAFSIIPVIKQVVNDFNEKVLNVRFERALFEKTGARISVINNEYHFRINVLVPKDHIIFNREGASCGRVEYVLNKDIAVCNMCYPEKYPLCNKRIIAENIIKGLEESEKELQKKYNDLKESLYKVQDYRHKLNLIKKLAEELNHEVPYEVQEYFDLYVRVSQ